jgi:four helix bundle protein
MISKDKTKTHKDLVVWQKAMNLVEEVYRLTEKMPQSELYGLTSQIRRAAVSIPSNIAEGAARNHDREFVQFLYVSLGSLAELETQLLLAERLKFMNTPPLDDLSEVKKLLLGLIKFKKHGEGR